MPKNPETHALSKKLKFMQGWGKLKYGFRFHMILAVLGPVFILLHANFRPGLPYSNVALFSMLLVIGRFFHASVYGGL